ncbi:MAG: hypothetical protein JZU60_02690 [Ilumatobacteraceae bacterium]|nr:hypothetical protein [Ilumatobacteraceae bacterium]
MANTTYVQVIEDGPRNAVVRVSALLDTSNLASTALVTKALFTNNDVAAGPLRGFRVDKVEFSVGADLSGIIEWEATTPQMVGVFHDSNEVEWAPGLQPNQAAAGYTGSLLFRTVNWLATVRGFTFTLRLIKLY